MGAPLLFSSTRRNAACVAPPPPPEPASDASTNTAASNSLSPFSAESARSDGISIREVTAEATAPAATSSSQGEQRRMSKLAANLANQYKRVPRKFGRKTKNSSNSIQKRSTVHLNIAPDAESESMQVSLMSEAQSSPLKGGDCVYSVGGVDYLVKHKTNAPLKNLIPSEKNTTNTEYKQASTGQATEKENFMKKRGNVNAVKPNGNNSMNEVASAAGGRENKKSKMGSLFKKSGKRGSSDGEKGSNNRGDQNRGGKDDSGDSKDNMNEDGNKDSGDKNDKRGRSPNDGTPFDPLQYFGPERTKFAEDSTLPLHNGSELSAPANYPSWTPVDGTKFKVRQGPNYSKNGRKEASLLSLYEVYCVRYFRSGKRTVSGATRIMPLPEASDDLEVMLDNGGKEQNDEDEGEKNEVAGHEGKDRARRPELRGTKIPDVLVVHFMLPYEPPNMFKQKDDGQGGECVYYLRPSRQFLDEISGCVPATPATNLFARWCVECEGDSKVRSRFKCMGLVRDIDRHNFGLLKTYNGKPVLITESGRACSGYHGGVRYLEMTVNVHCWAFMAKKGFVSLMPKFASMQMEVGFTIEARADSEMPECMLGSTVLSYIGETTGPMITAEMQEPVHEHQM